MILETSQSYLPIPRKQGTTSSGHRSALHRRVVCSNWWQKIGNGASSWETGRWSSVCETSLVYRRSWKARLQQKILSQKIIESRCLRVFSSLFPLACAQASVTGVTEKLKSVLFPSPAKRPPISHLQSRHWQCLRVKPVTQQGTVLLQAACGRG